jgi:hypothetical protein
MIKSLTASYFTISSRAMSAASERRRRKIKNVERKKEKGKAVSDGRMKRKNQKENLSVGVVRWWDPPGAGW